MTQTILVTGANGFFGSKLVPILRRDWRIIAGMRSGPAKKDTRILGDISDLPDFSIALKGIDCVIHCAARAHKTNESPNYNTLKMYMRTNCESTLHLATKAAELGVRRFIFLSSIGVNGNQTFGTPFSQNDLPTPNAPYAISKLEAEKGLLKIAKETGLEVVIIRPTLIIGQKPVGNLRRLLRLIEIGIPLPFGLATTNRRSLVSAEVLADLIRVCINHPNAPGQPILVADAVPYSTRQILERLASLTGKRLWLFPMPVVLLKAALKVISLTRISNQLFGDLEVDISETNTRLDWCPPATEPKHEEK